MNRVYSVKQLNQYLKRLVENDLFLSDLSVCGAVSNVKYHTGGHIYFTLKEAGSQINAVMFQSYRAKGLKADIRDGMKVKVRGSVGIYEAGGRYQLYASEISPDGEGDLFLRFQELKARLAELGLFDPAYKKPIPKYAMTIGVVTSPTGAALQDIIRVARERNPKVSILLSPALVQGDGAAESIAEAVRKLDEAHPDVMIVGRGGGSFEDLFPFNEEIVARAIFDADTPVISAVGHEIDESIADYTADYRAATPSQAAEIAVFLLDRLYETYGEKEKEMRDSLLQSISGFRMNLNRMEAVLNASHPKQVIREQIFRLSELRTALQSLIEAHHEKEKNRFLILSERLNHLSPLQRLTGGYGYVTKDGTPVTSVGAIRENDLVRITFRDGQAETRVLKTERHE